MRCVHNTKDKQLTISKLYRHVGRHCRSHKLVGSAMFIMSLDAIHRSSRMQMQTLAYLCRTKWEYDQWPNESLS